MKRILAFFVIFTIFSGFLLCMELTLISEMEANTIAMNWIALINKIPLENKLDEYQISSIERIIYNGTLLCEAYHLYPNGHILIPSYREFPPIKSFSVISDFNIKSNGYEYAVLEELKAAYESIKRYVPGKSEELEMSIKRNSNQWNRFAQVELDRAILKEQKSISNRDNFDIKAYVLEDRFGTKLKAINAPPLLKTKWDQDSPYWNQCPILWGERCYVGCVATAMAQIMRYYKWPKQGQGSYSYYWENGSRWLSANFSDSYDWEYMPNRTSDYDTTREKNAVAELSYETGVSVDMEYSYYGSYAFSSDVAYALKTFFKYSNNVKVVLRSDYNNVDQWFEVLKRQRDLSRPVEFAMYTWEPSGHAVVIDGYLTTAGLNQVHINMGWDGAYDAYYTLDNILVFTKTSWQHAVINIIPMGAKIQLNKSSLSFNGVEGQSNPGPQYIKIRNSGIKTLNYQIRCNRFWLNVSPESGRTNGEWDKIRVSTDIYSLSEGNYSGSISISSDDATNSPQDISVNLIVKPPPIYAPINFSGVKVENRSLSQLEYINVLTWSANPLNRHITKYRIYLEEGEILTLLAEVDAKTFEYRHRKVERIYNYILKAVDYKNREGEPAYLIVQ